MKWPKLLFVFYNKSKRTVFHTLIMNLKLINTQNTAKEQIKSQKSRRRIAKY